MDQCLGYYEFFHDTKNFPKLFDVILSNKFCEDLVLTFFVTSLKNEIAFLNGDSLMESTHKNILMWQQFLDSEGVGDMLLLDSIKLYSMSLLQSMEAVFSLVLTADIYEGKITFLSIATSI